MSWSSGVRAGLFSLGSVLDSNMAEAELGMRKCLGISMDYVTGPGVRKEVKEEKEMDDNVNHPAHYTDGMIEVIDYIEDKGFPYHLGNAIKYISRAGKKDPEKTIEDLQKAVWYIERYIGLLQK